MKAFPVTFVMALTLKTECIRSRVSVNDRARLRLQSRSQVSGTAREPWRSPVVRPAATRDRGGLGARYEDRDRRWQVGVEGLDQPIGRRCGLLNIHGGAQAAAGGEALGDQWFTRPRKRRDLGVLCQTEGARRRRSPGPRRLLGLAARAAPFDRVWSRGRSRSRWGSRGRHGI